MYTLFFAPGTAAMAPHAVIEEIGAPYELVRLDLAAREHHRPDYKKLNPNGRVPTLVDGDVVVFEAAAICLHLLDRHGGAGLVPPSGTAERSLFYQWLIYLTNTMQEGFVHWYHPDWFADAAPARADFKSVAERRLYAMCDVLDATLARAPFLAGEAATLPDLYLTMLVRWSRALPRPAWLWPNVKRVAGTVHQRPAFQRMMAKQGIVWAENWPG